MNHKSTRNHYKMAVEQMNIIKLHFKKKLIFCLITLLATFCICLLILLTIEYNIYMRDTFYKSIFGIQDINKQNILFSNGQIIQKGSARYLVLTCRPPLFPLSPMMLGRVAFVFDDKGRLVAQTKNDRDDTRFWAEYQDWPNINLPAQTLDLLINTKGSDILATYHDILQTHPPSLE